MESRGRGCGKGQARSFSSSQLAVPYGSGLLPRAALSLTPRRGTRTWPTRSGFSSVPRWESDAGIQVAPPVTFRNSAARRTTIETLRRAGVTFRRTLGSLAAPRGSHGTLSNRYWLAECCAGAAQTEWRGVTQALSIDGSNPNHN
jgi:hypothetical protein